MTKKSLSIVLVVTLFGGLLLVLGLQQKKPEDTGLAFLEGLSQDTREQGEGIVREPAVAGQFYPADPQALQEQVDEFLANAQAVQAQGEIFGLLLPHAGYQFSGQVAAFGAKALEGKHFDTIILIGNSHTERFDGISVFPAGFFKTPLGEIEIDNELAKKIMAENKRIFFKESAHQKEHSLEVELPFLQKTLQNFKIVPILFGNSGGEDYKILAQALLKHIQNKNVLLLASSDLSHYPPYEKANYADKKTMGAILTGEVSELEKTIRDLEKEGIEGAVTFACGIDAIKTVMLVAAGLEEDEIKLLNYANSGDAEGGDKSRVVGYGAIGFFGKRQASEENLLNKEQQKTLLEIARSSVENFIKEGEIPNFKVEDDALNQNLGTFVTLKKNGQLRGCIGRFSPYSETPQGVSDGSSSIRESELKNRPTDIPLYQVVSQMAVAAATQDVRFYPVRESELPELHYEISVLSPPQKIGSWQEITLGKHGVILKRGASSGVFLPQVAFENNWDLDKFMGELCSQKAGLDWDCWKKDDVELFVFTAQIFEED